MNKFKLLKIISAIVLCIAATVALTFAVNTSFRHEEPLVYVTRYGKKYHSHDCGYLWSSAVPIGEYEATSNGYTPCSRCGGISSGTIIVDDYGASVSISAVTVGILAFIGLLAYSLKRE